MSNSNLFQVKEEEDDEKKIISSEDIQLPTSKNQDKCIEDIALGQHGAVDRNLDENNPDHDDKNEIFLEDCSEDPDKGRPRSEQFGTIQRRSTQTLCEDDDTHKSRNDRDDDDDGFITPTSSDHKIPVMTKCPPAPKKTVKRKFSDSPNIHPTLHVDFEDLEENIKKLRKKDHQE
ncbi:uncharacterized protein LOC129875994 [Solanum dulcamara]|uniref:uncharacterized protein LOC129875994 n=1 Tax=Solanum dulcamara TaxID=45834 RepID=UPI002485D398|nr:uncharacterized protein LOC129875994 [Solanum dulcamara]